MTEPAVPPERLAEFLADHNDVCELIELAHANNFSGWQEKLAELDRRHREEGGDPSAFIWALSHIAADYLYRSATRMGFSFEEALRRMRLQGIDIAEGSAE